MKHTNPIAKELCRPIINKNGTKTGGTAAMLRNIKEAGGIDHVIDKVQESTIKATAAELFLNDIASEKRENIKKTS